MVVTCYIKLLNFRVSSPSSRCDKNYMLLTLLEESLFYLVHWSLTTISIHFQFIITNICRCLYCIQLKEKWVGVKDYVFQVYFFTLLWDFVDLKYMYCHSFMRCWLFTNKSCLFGVFYDFSHWIFSCLSRISTKYNWKK